jgi:uncharacterized protein with LGFP repeats
MNTPTSEGPGRIFLSYRREDTAYAAGWLYDRLADRFGEERVFKDVDSIQFGADFVEEIMTAVGSCVVLLALIGNRWLTTADQAGQRRIDDPADFVRLEIEAALTRGIRVIPVLVEGARMPRSADLPASLEALARRQAVELSPTRFASDIGPLFKMLGSLKALGSVKALGNATQRALDADTFAALKPIEGARRLARMSEDDAVITLAGALVSAAAEALEVLMSEKETTSLAILLLARMRRNKAEELIAATSNLAPRLELLPAAAEAIEHFLAMAGPELGVAIRPLDYASPSPQGTQGFYQRFRTGQVYWTPQGGARATTGAIADYHIALGGSGGRLGFPVTAEVDAAISQFGQRGSYQRFEGLGDYGPDVCKLTGRCGATVYWSPKRGPHATWGSIGVCYELNQGPRGRLGFPVADEVRVGPSRREAGGAVGWCQRFEGGAIYYSDKTETIMVYDPIAEYHETHGGVASLLGFPVSPDLEAAESPYGTTGHCQRFEGRQAYPEDILKSWSDEEGTAGAIIYTSQAHGTHCVYGDNGIYYERIFGTSSWLGFPTSDERPAEPRVFDNASHLSVQEFEGGTVFAKAGLGSVAVRRAIMDYLSRNDDLRLRIGFPVREERSLTSEDDEQIQFFENGVVTVKNGAPEVWLRP